MEIAACTRLDEVPEFLVAFALFGSLQVSRTRLAPAIDTIQLGGAADS